MKYALTLLMLLLGHVLYSQETRKLDEVEEVKKAFEPRGTDLSKNQQEAIENDIGKILGLNIAKDSIKDSIAMYTFAISVKIEKRRKTVDIKEIKSNDTICYKIWPKLDSLLKGKGIDWGVLAPNKGISEIIIPISIIVMNHNNSSDNPTVSLLDMESKLNALFAKNIISKNCMYLHPMIVRMYKRTYD